MKPCHENNGAASYVGRVATVHNPLLNVCSNTFQNLLWSVHGQGQKC